MFWEYFIKYKYHQRSSEFQHEQAYYICQITPHSVFPFVKIMCLIEMPNFSEDNHTYLHLFQNSFLNFNLDKVILLLMIKLELESV